MSRRDALHVLAGLAVAAAVPPALGQTAARIRRVAWFVSGTGLSESDFLAVRDPLLRRRGWVAGRNVALTFRQASNADQALIDRYAAELAGAGMDAVLTRGELQTRALMRATATTPIVFTQTGDPVAAGFVASLSRPGKNLTGYAVLGDEQRKKRIEAVREIVPQAGKIAMFMYQIPRTPRVVEGEARFAELFVPLGIRMVYVYAPTAADTDAAIDEAARQRVDALIAPNTSYDNAAAIVAAAIRNRLPLVGQDPRLIEAGGLLSVSTDYAEENEVTIDLLDRILRGANPALLPVRQATRFEVVVNEKTAHVLGLRIPQSLLLRARVVQ